MNRHENGRFYSFNIPKSVLIIIFVYYNTFIVIVAVAVKDPPNPDYPSSLTRINKLSYT